jgi:alkaline phosphatase D
MTVGPLNGSPEQAETDTHYLDNPLEAQNFGLIQFDWKNKIANIQIIDEKNQVAQKLTLKTR